MNFSTEFENDIKTHVLKIIRDDGLHRHLRYQRTGTMFMHFDLITWPGYLCYTGDMGTFVFRRLDDMLQFFRKPEKRDPYKMDMRYWAQKLEAADKDGGFEKFSPDKFAENIKEQFDEYVSEELETPTPEVVTAIWSEIESSVLRWLDEDAESEAAAMRAAMDFTHAGRHLFQDFWETRGQDYTYHFQWCCYALEWAVDVYDKAGTARLDATRPAGNPNYVPAVLIEGA